MCIALPTSFDDAVTRTREALAGGPGLLTEIDVKVTLNAKLGEDMEAACRAHGPGPRPAAGS